MTRDDAGSLFQKLRPFAVVALIFLASRMVVVAAMVFAREYLIPNERAPATWTDPFVQWDAYWYLLIARDGYSFNGDPAQLNPVVFYPLYPLLSRFVSLVSGADLAATAIVLANVFALAALCSVYALAREVFDEDESLGAVALISFFPSSIFLSAAYTEPLLLLLAVTSLALLSRRRFVAASLIAGLATATRSSGVVLAPVITATIALATPLGWRRLPLLAVCGGLSVAGLAAFMAYQWLAFDMPLAFASGQTAWHGSDWSGRIRDALLLKPLLGLRLTGIGPVDFDKVVFVAFIGLAIAGCRFLPWQWSAFAFAALLLPYVTLGGGPQGLTSMSRFSIVAFPVFITAAHLLKGRPLLTGAVYALLASQLFMWAAMFSQGRWVG